jgi:hypothetical protein
MALRFAARQPPPQQTKSGFAGDPEPSPQQTKTGFAGDPGPAAQGSNSFLPFPGTYPSARGCAASGTWPGYYQSRLSALGVFGDSVLKSHS